MSEGMPPVRATKSSRERENIADSESAGSKSSESQKRGMDSFCAFFAPEAGSQNRPGNWDDHPGFWDDRYSDLSSASLGLMLHWL